MEGWMDGWKDGWMDGQKFSNKEPRLYQISLALLTILKLVVCIPLRVLGQVQGFRLTQHWFEYFIQ
jgi:hypothetical protein